MLMAASPSREWPPESAETRSQNQEVDEASFQPPIVGHIMGWVYRIYPRKTNGFGSESSKGDHFFQRKGFICLPKDAFFRGYDYGYV